MRWTRCYIMFMVGCVCLGLPGCSPYTLQGRVVDGAPGGAWIVAADDARLMRHHRIGVAGAVVAGTIDPHSMKPTELRTVTTDADGFFTMTIPSFGAGMLIYDVELLVRRTGNEHVERVLGLPGKDKRILVKLVPGRDTYTPRKDFMDETLRLSEPFMKP